MSIQEWVRKARTHARLSQQELGEKLGRSKANIGHWETGKHEPSIGQVDQISRLTNFPAPPIGVQPAIEPSSPSQPLFTAELLAVLQKLDPAALLKAENMLRVHLDMKPLEYEANEKAA